MPKRFTFDVEFDAPVTEVWRVVSDTDVIDEAAGLPAVTYRDEPQEDGTTRRFGSYRARGFLFAYEELPFKWVHEQGFEVTRIYNKGAFKTFLHTCKLIPKDENDPDAGCTVRTTFEFEPRGFLGLFASSGTKTSGVVPYKKIFEQASTRLKKKAWREKTHSVILKRPVAVGPDGKPVDEVNHATLGQLKQRVRELDDSPLVEKLAEAVANLPPDELRRMQPYAFARKWSASRQQTLNQFLAGTRAGMLKMRWDVICPHCRGDKLNLNSLVEVKETAFCPSCNIDFDVDLDRSLEPVFTPHPQIREIPDAHYCLGGPGTTPHIVYQNRLAPGDEHEFSFRLASGRYRVRFSGEGAYRWIEVGDTEEGRPSYEITDEEIEGTDCRCDEDQPIHVSVRNKSFRPVLTSIESVQWATDSLSAGELVADQRFRDLFSNEVLAPGIKLAVEDSTILFTDLVGSTAMYNALGDAKAYALVRTHFDVLHEIVGQFRGAIVKTIGDAIMAVFSKPEDALNAAHELHKRTDSYVKQQGHREGADLKIGVHCGPCIAVTLNERLDYFGTTVNLAARVQGMSEGGDILVSQMLADRTNDCAPLRQQAWESTPEHAHAKGFKDPVPVLRFTQAV